MPIDITLPLELNRRQGDYGALSNPVLNDEGHIVVESVNYGHLYFVAETGAQLHNGENDNPLRLRNKSAEVAVKIFKVWFGHADWAKTDWRYLQDDSLYSFDNGKLANEKAKALNAESTEAGAPWRFMVKNETIMSPNHQWREWMQARFDSGEYSGVPWAGESWYNSDHFAHAAMSDPFKVAFIESPAAGAEDKMTVLTPGRYLERFFSEHLTAQEIAQWAARLDNEAELLFASTPEEIVAIYTDSGVESCMKYAADSTQFPLGVQPTSIYGAGDLQLAYLKRRDKIVARALVWPEHKRVGRVYGDIERLKNRLIGEGYTYEDGNRDVFEGAKLLRVEVNGEIVMPYLDWQMGANEAGDGQHLIITSNRDGRATYKGQTTNGTASGRAIQVCGHNGCRTFMTEVEGWYNSDTGRNMCFSCTDAHLVRCVISGDNYPREGGRRAHMHQIMRRDGVTPFEGIRGGWVRREALADYGSNHYRLIGDVVYPVSETRVVPGRTRVFEPLPMEG